VRTVTKIQTPDWTETKHTMPSIGEKVVVYLWMDKTVNQAWWNGEHYIVVAADEEGQVQIYQVQATAISHWQNMPERPAHANNVHIMDETRQYGVMH